MLGQPTGSTMLGLLDLDKGSFGVAQVDVDGAMHKTVMQADNVTQLAGQSPPQHPEVFDPATTLSSLRSGRLLAVRRRPRAYDARHVQPVEGPQRGP